MPFVKTELTLTVINAKDLVRFKQMYKHIKGSEGFCDIYRYLEGLLRMTDIVYTIMCGVFRQFSLIDRLWFGG